MLTVTLNEMDLRAFLTAFNAIAEVSDYNFDAETEYRMAIANLVGSLKDQLPPGSREMISVVPRVGLSSLLEEKYADWNAGCAAGTLCQPADEIIGEFLDKSDYDRGQFTADGEAGGAIAQLFALLTAESAEGWDRYELALCASSREELERLTLSDLLAVLFAAEGRGGAGGFFWERWTRK